MYQLLHFHQCASPVVDSQGVHDCAQVLRSPANRGSLVQHSLRLVEIRAMRRRYSLDGRASANNDNASVVVVDVPAAIRRVLEGSDD